MKSLFHGCSSTCMELAPHPTDQTCFSHHLCSLVGKVQQHHRQEIASELSCCKFCDERALGVTGDWCNAQTYLYITIHRMGFIRRLLLQCGVYFEGVGHVHHFQNLILQECNDISYFLESAFDTQQSTYSYVKCVILRFIFGVDSVYQHSYLHSLPCDTKHALS